MKRRRRKNRAKKAIIWTVCAILMAAAAVFGAMGFYKLLGEYRAEQDYKDLEQRFIMENDTQAEERAESIWDLENIAAWIEIPCIGVSYPVMKGLDNEYYQHRDTAGAYSFPGSLFIDMYCPYDLSGGNTVIYGHNMRNGTMFGRLWHIAYKGAADDDPFFYVTTAENTCKYRIFSAFEDVRCSEAFRQYDKGSSEFADWVKRMKDSSISALFRYDPDPDESIVTLATCGASEDIRTIVMGALVIE